MGRHLTLSMFVLAAWGVGCSCDDGNPDRPDAGPCGSGQVLDPDTGACVDPAPSCAADAPGSILARCAEEQRSCYEDDQEVRCGACLVGYREGGAGACTAVARCEDLDCAARSRACLEAGDHVDATCGACLAGEEDSAGACAVASCELSGTLASLCASQQRVCVEDASGARCGACLSGHVEVAGSCEPTRTCASLGCVLRGRTCTPAAPGVHARCGVCLAGMEEHDGACRPVPGAVCSDAAGVGILPACQQASRQCEETTEGARCGVCTGDTIENAETGRCDAQVICAELGCEDDHRGCAEEPNGHCTGCLDGFVEDPASGACRSVVSCAELSCADDEECAEAMASSDAFCRLDCGGRAIWDGARCVSCPPCSAPGETGRVWPMLTASGACICETEPGYYYSLSGAIGPVPCDADHDGWIRESARTTIESNDPALAANVRCELRTIDRFELTNERGQSRTVELALPDGLALYESDRNDDDDLLQAVWSSRGYPAYGRVPAAAELNRLTKLCHDPLLDYNDNRTPDVVEFAGQDLGPGMRPEQRFFDDMAYFVELHHGWYAPPEGDGAHGRYLIQERSRLAGSSTPLPERVPIEYFYPETIEHSSTVRPDCCAPEDCTDNLELCAGAAPPACCSPQYCLEDPFCDPDHVHSSNLVYQAEGSRHPSASSPDVVEVDPEASAGQVRVARRGWPSWPAPYTSGNNDYSVWRRWMGAGKLDGQFTVRMKARVDDPSSSEPLAVFTCKYGSPLTLSDTQTIRPSDFAASATWTHFELNCEFRNGQAYSIELYDFYPGLTDLYIDTFSIERPSVVLPHEHALGHWRVCEVWRDSEWDTQIPPIGMDFAGHSPPPPAPGETLEWSGMNHHSQFKCILANPAPGGTIPTELSPGQIDAARYRLNRCAAAAEPDAAGDDNPARMPIACEQILAEELRGGDVVWAAVPYRSHGPDGVDYQRGCVNACVHRLVNQCITGDPLAADCVSDAWSFGKFSACTTREICNGLDDNGDPNSFVDENSVHEYPIGSGQLVAMGTPCATGEDGVCAAGAWHCLSGSPTCVSDQPASPEVCNGLDDDCNGVPDNGIAEFGLSCTDPGRLGVCKDGIFECHGEAGLQCVQLITPTADELACDGVNEDCDGRTDEPPDDGTCEGDWTWVYPDGDGDGFGMDQQTRFSQGIEPKCVCRNALHAGRWPANGWVDNQADCCDQDDKTHPYEGEAPWFILPNRCDDGSGTKFDYDCKSSPFGDPRWPSPAQVGCGLQSAGVCRPGGDGWASIIPPRCGDIALFHLGPTTAADGSGCNFWCSQITINMQQPCH